MTPISREVEAATSPPSSDPSLRPYAHAELETQNVHANAPEGPSDQDDPWDPTEVANPAPIQQSLGSVKRHSHRPQPLETSGEGDTPISDEARDVHRWSTPTPHADPRSDALTRQTPPWLARVFLVSHLVFFAILGTLARLGVQWIVWYPGTPVVLPVLWANFAGSLVMGFLVEDRMLFMSRADRRRLRGTENLRARLFQRSKTRKQQDGDQQMTSAKTQRKTIPLYVGLTTGFCGCFTSFSAFARDSFLALSNDLPTPIVHPQTTASTVNRKIGYSFQAWLNVVILTLALSLGAFAAGSHIAIFLDPVTPRIHSRRIARRIVDPAMVGLAIICWLAAVFLSIWPPDHPSGPSSPGTWANETWPREALFALALAPPGCLLRFYASVNFNRLVASFPLGTFASNMLGTAVLAMCWDLQHVGVGTTGRVGGGYIGCQILQGVMDGWCGGLTTVSSWAAEIYGLRRAHGWVYAAASIVGATSLTVIIMGSVRWTIGWQPTVCATGYPSKLSG